MFPSSNRDSAIGFQLGVSMDVIRNDGLFQPAKIKWLQKWKHSFCVIECPSHVGVSHHVDAISDCFSDCPNHIHIALHPLGPVDRAPTEAQFNCLESRIPIAPRFTGELA